MVETKFSSMNEDQDWIEVFGLVIAASLRCGFDVGNRIGATLKSNCKTPPIIRPN